MKKKILFLIESFAGGGVEKVFIDLINNMDISKYDITVMSIWDYGVRKKNLRKDVKYKSNFPNIRGISRVFHNFVEKIEASNSCLNVTIQFAVLHCREFFSLPNTLLMSAQNTFLPSSTLILMIDNNFKHFFH